MEWFVWFVHVFPHVREQANIALAENVGKRIQTIQTVPQTIHKPLEKTVQTTQTICFWGVMLKRPPKSDGLCGLYHVFQWFVDGLWNGLYGLCVFFHMLVNRQIPRARGYEV